MIECLGAEKSAAENSPGHIRRRKITISLEDSLNALLGYYAREGAAPDQAGSWIEAEIERVFNHPGVDKSRRHARVGALLRARDLNRFVLSEPDLAALKVSLFESLLFHRSTPERWAAARSMLLKNVHHICQSSLPGSLHAVEQVKRMVSDRSSRMGKLLTAIALYNFDRDEESPPQNLLLHFLPGRFPGHTWEICGSNGRVVMMAGAESWSPVNPLCRWEFLGADLFHHLVRDASRGSEGVEPSPSPARVSTRNDPGSQAFSSEFSSEFPSDASPPMAGLAMASQPGAPAPQPVYCRFPGPRTSLSASPIPGSRTSLSASPIPGSRTSLSASPLEDAKEGVTAGETAGETAQLELFPLERRTFLAELMRLVQRKHGPEGTRLLALLFAHFDRCPPGREVEVRLEEMAMEIAFGDLSARGARARMQRLEKVISRLADVELTRIAGPAPGLGGDPIAAAGTRPIARVSRLLTVMSRSGALNSGQKRAGKDLPEGSGNALDGSPNGGQATPTSPVADRLRVWIDPVFHGDGSGFGAGSLGAPFRDLPEFLLEAPAKDHPHAIALLVYLRLCWAESRAEPRAGGEEALPGIECSAGQLMHDAGLWVSPSGRYRALEALKHDLDLLREHGCIGSWRMQRSQMRDAMEDRYRIAPPVSGQPRDAGMGAAGARRAHMGEGL